MRAVVALFAVSTITATITATATVAHAECEKDSLTVGARAPNFASLGALGPDGKAFTLPKGKWALFTVGASWCKPCAKELPAWDKVAAEMKGKVSFFSINIDHDKAEGAKFFDKLKIKTMGRVFLSEDKAGSLAAVMPSTYIIDPKGVVRLAHCGFEKGDVDGEIKKLRGELTKLVK